MGKRTTIRDISAATGVSVATVSYVLNNTPGKSISRKTRDRVLAAANELNYYSAISREQMQEAVGCIGLVLNHDLSLGRYSHILNGIVSTLREKDINLLILSSRTLPGKKYPEYINAFLSRQIDGIIYVSSGLERIDDAIQNFVVERNIPFVTCDCETNRYIPSVDIDYLTGAYDMTRFILSKGVTKVHYIRPEKREGVISRQENERELGVKRAVYEQGNCELEEYYINADNLRQELSPSGETAGRLLAETVPGSAYLGSWSVMDMLLLKLSEISRKNVPVATLAHGSIPAGFIPNLFYTFIPTFELGKACAEQMMKLIRGNNDAEHLMMGCITPLDGDKYLPYVDI